jgi:shikimate kinase
MGSSMTMSAATEIDEGAIRRAAADAIAGRSLVFVGLMGAGKSVIGRMTAAALDMNFVDSDAEIERVSSMSIAELFEAYGEVEFRSLEARVIKRLLQTGPRVVSTGGGAFVNAETRALIKARSLSIWLKADLDVLWERVSKRDNRPLLKTADPRGTLDSLMRARYPIYGEADITVQSRNVRKEVIVEETLALIAARGAGN